jgi:uncharacterized membrane protein
MANDLPGLLSALVAIVTLPLGILTALFVGLEAAAVVFVVGWLLLVPTIAVVGEELLPTLRERAADAESEDPADPLEELKRRYARGEIDDEEFERQVGKLVGVEDVDLGGESDPDQLTERDLDRIRE